MTTIYELQQRAKMLRTKTQAGSITPDEVGSLHEDTLAYIAALEQSTDSLGIKKVYPSKSAMEADTTPVGNNGKAIRHGQLACIYDHANPESTDNGDIYTYQASGWLKIGNIAAETNISVAQDLGDSPVKVMSQKAVTDAIRKDAHKIEEHVSVNMSAYNWRKGGIKKDNGTEHVYEQQIFVFSEKIHVDGYTSIELQYQTFATGYCTALYDASDNVIQVFGVDVQGQNGGYNKTLFKLPANASYLRFTGYLKQLPTLTLIKEMSISTKINQIDGDLGKLRDSTKSLFIKDITNDIAYTPGGINTSDGAYNPNAWSVFAASDFIEIPATAVKINIGYQSFTDGYCTALYDNNKAFIKGYAYPKDAGKLGDVRTTGEIDVPAGAKFVRLTGYLPNKSQAKIPLVFITNQADIVTHDELAKAGITSPIKSKKLAFCGDSITFGANPDGGEAPLDAWPQQVGRLLGCQVTNYGVNGASAGGSSPRVWSKEYNVVAEDTDIIGVMIGVNDWAHGYAIGSVEQKTGFCGALHTMWQGLLKRFPPSSGKRLFCMIYPRIDAKPVAGTPTWDVWTKAIREVAEYYAIPILDFSKELGIDPHFDTEYIYWRKMAGTTDGTHDAHPTQITHNMMGKVVAAYVKSHYDV